MGRVNAIDLNRSFNAIAKDLGARGKQELRAKVVNGDQVVVYSKSVSAFRKIVDNLFFNRAAKRQAAANLLVQRFTYLPVATQKAAMGHVREAKPSAAAAALAFSEASKPISGLQLSDLAKPEYAVYFADFLREVLHSGEAKKAMKDGEAKRLLDLITVAHSSARDARNFLAGFMAEMAVNDDNSEVNVPPEKQVAVVKALGLDLPGFVLHGELPKGGTSWNQSQFQDAMKRYDWNQLRDSTYSAAQISAALAPAIGDIAASFRADNNMVTAFRNWQKSSSNA